MDSGGSTESDDDSRIDEGPEENYAETLASLEGQTEYFEEQPNVSSIHGSISNDILNKSESSEVTEGPEENYAERVTLASLEKEAEYIEEQLTVSSIHSGTSNDRLHERESSDDTDRSDLNETESDSYETGSDFDENVEDGTYFYNEDPLQNSDDENEDPLQRSDDDEMHENYQVILDIFQCINNKKCLRQFYFRYLKFEQVEISLTFSEFDFYPGSWDS